MSKKLSKIAGLTRGKRQVSPERELATDLTKYRRSTYYLKPETQMALKIMAIKQDKKLTTLVREALEEYVARHSREWA